MIRPKEMLSIPVETDRAANAWTVWLGKNKNTMNENIAMQIFTKSYCENPACVMERKEVDEYSQPLYL